MARLRVRGGCKPLPNKVKLKDFGGTAQSSGHDDNDDDDYMDFVI